MKPVASSTVDSLTAIWQHVLQLSSVGVNDNFFDLGGDSALTLELFNEIATAFRRELPPVLIYQAPTITELAALLERPSSPQVSPIAVLKTGSEAPPVFIAPGLGGSVIDFFQVVRHIDTGHAIYGMQAKGIDGVEEPLNRIEDMAQYSLDAVKQLQPHGPYSLVGFSLGGLVTLEMAQRLTAEGEKIALLAMLDSYPNMRYLSWPQRVRLGGRQTWRRTARRLKWLGVPPPFETSVDTPSSITLQRFRDSSYEALERYRPRFYPGQINFVRASIVTDFPADPVAVWSHLCDALVIDTAPGDHLGIMTTHFQGLAFIISSLLRSALSA